MLEFIKVHQLGGGATWLRVDKIACFQGFKSGTEVRVVGKGLGIVLRETPEELVALLNSTGEDAPSVPDEDQPFLLWPMASGRAKALGFEVSDRFLIDVQEVLSFDDISLVRIEEVLLAAERCRFFAKGQKRAGIPG